MIKREVAIGINSFINEPGIQSAIDAYVDNHVETLSSSLLSTKDWESTLEIRGKIKALLNLKQLRAETLQALKEHNGKKEKI